jgi:hypothetical protein
MHWELDGVNECCCEIVDSRKNFIYEKCEEGDKDGYCKRTGDCDDYQPNCGSQHLNVCEGAASDNCDVVRVVCHNPTAEQLTVVGRAVVNGEKQSGPE